MGKYIRHGLGLRVVPRSPVDACTLKLLLVSVTEHQSALRTCRGDTYPDHT